MRMLRCTITSLFLGTCALPLVTAEAAPLLCKITESDITFRLDINGSVADVLVGTLTSTPKLLFRSVPVQKQGKVLLVEAGPQHSLAKAYGKSCHRVVNSYTLKVEDQGNRQYRGELQVTPLFDKIPNAPKDCKSISAPEFLDATFSNVICLMSNT